MTTTPKVAMLLGLALAALLVGMSAPSRIHSVGALSPQGTGDPLVYSTFLGGRCGSDQPRRIAVDLAGNVYLAGSTCAEDFPTTSGAFNRTFPDGAMYRMFVAKISAAHQLAYSTFLGGSSGFWNDDPFALVVDLAGNAYVAGVTNSSNFPATPGAYQQTYGGNDDAFLLKLSADGSSLLYATFLGGRTGDGATGLAVDAAGNAYVTGWTTDHWAGGPSLGTDNFPTTPGAFNRTYAGDDDGWVAKISPDGRHLLYSTLLGGTGADVPYAIRVDREGNSFVAGETTSPDFPVTPGAFASRVTPARSATEALADRDVFVTKVSADGSLLMYSTLYGGNGYDSPAEVILDARGHAYVAGFSTSSDLPVTAGAVQRHNVSFQNGFLVEFSTTGTDVLYATYLGGGGEYVTGLAWRNASELVLAGVTMSDTFPTTPGAYRDARDGSEDGFVAAIDVGNGTLTYSTLLGGLGADEIQGMALNPAGHAVVFGFTTSPDFPLTSDHLPYPTNGWGDMFVSELALVAKPPAPTTSVPTWAMVAIVGTGAGAAGLAAFVVLRLRGIRRPPTSPPPR